MQLNCAVLLAVAAILASAINGVDSKPAQFPSLAATRLLRTGTSAVTSDETRATPGLDSVATFFKSRVATRKKLNELVKSGRSTDDAFSFLKLDDAWDDIFSNPDFKVWMKYVAKSEVNPDVAVVVKLREQFGGEAATAGLLQTATTVTGTEKVARRLQKTQFELWFKWGIRPEAVPEEIFRYNAVDWSELHHFTPARQARYAYRLYLDKAHPNWPNTM